jgi:anti-sigma28 factor (negative regulator of flagellin synthesis)
MTLDDADLSPKDPEADRASAESRVRVLRELVQESLYVVDEQAVADAIIRQGWAWLSVPGG